jgi:putative intracellular protease/amidase
MSNDQSIAILLYDKLTALDAIGPYEVLRNLPGWTVTFVGLERGEVRTDSGRLGLTVDATLAELPDPTVFVIPGGPGQTALMDNEEVLGWVRKAHATSEWTTSVCTGSLILAAAGVLEGLQATSHWLALPQLEEFGATPTLQRVVEQGKVITAAGVSSGIDMALTLAARIMGDEVAQAIQLGIEYDPQPPFDAGSPEKAPESVVEFLRASSRFILEGT